jgi:beta-lactamase regulating signal transducer with metallopeptidase domain
MNWILENWAQRLLSASLQGAVVLAIVLCIVGYVPKLPPLAKVWALRIALAKLLVSAIFVGGLGLTLATRSTQTSSDGVSLFASVTAVLLPMAFALWVICLCTGVWRHARSRRQLHALVHEAELVSDYRVIQTYRQMCRNMGTVNPPVLKTIEGIPSPFLIQNGVASILLPSHLIDQVDSHNLEAALAHELAHHNHADLKWGWLSAAADLLFFFHPFVTPAIKKLRLAEECAADAAAMRATKSSPSTYSRTLLSFAETSLALSGAYAMADSAVELDKRIKELYGPKHSRGGRAVALCVLALASLALMPWTLHAESAKEGEVYRPAAIAAPMAVGARAVAPPFLAR